ncbi:DUF421 domain-containing protein [Egibacter rhizosphaerae]|uniref:DUF421 domain-containing protein n=1 Tax=Egibacter rhizosphaerae TaxID=1670831 RepID=A0A411YDM2_9ACTN|nr:YetF domain-containing protein [Egibacter rhizosphaerae]QBI19290.1 DUF421 domain-containing protein [Egibacter rhizosphaerae]
MEDVVFFTDGWGAIARTLVVTAVTYVALVLMVRASGQRTLARMTPFDFILAVTLGSAFGRVVTATEVGTIDAVVALATLIGIQWLVVWLRARVPAVARAVNARPSLLYHDGALQRDAMRRHRLTEQDVLVNLREKGLGSLAQAHTIILEPDGEFSVVTADKIGDGEALARLNET